MRRELLSLRPPGLSPGGSRLPIGPKLAHASSMGSSVAGHDPPYFSFLPVKTEVLKNLIAEPRPPSKLISVTAPTGYGKTVFLADLHAHYSAQGARCHWLALDDRDISIERVLSHFEASLVSPVGEVNTFQAIHQGDESPEERIGVLLEALALSSGPTIIFVDNLNYCSDETLHRLLDALIFRTPSWVYFVLSSTDQQPFNQARAKLEARLKSVGFSDLSLNTDAIRELLGNALCSRLTPAAIEAIAKQTEGWPAAVRLMQIILSSSENPEAALGRFSGADEDLAALLNRQVLQEFDVASRRFLLEISLLRTFGVNLCRQATGDVNAAEHIRRLLKQNVFVIPLDRNRSWYRLHALFREFLLDEAQRQIPLPRRREILARAAEWCEHEGRWQDAIDYALEAESIPLASAILERVAPMFVRDRGDLRQFIEWVERLHASGDRGGLDADYWYVWALVFHRRYEYARQQMNQLVDRLRGADASALNDYERVVFQRRIEVIRIAIDTYTDRGADAYAHSIRWMPESTGDDDPFSVATVASAASIYLLSSFDLVGARKTMRTAQSNITQAQSDYGVGWTMAITSMISLHEGDYAQTHQDLLAALSRAKLVLGETAGITTTIALVAAKSAVEIGNDQEARELLQLGMRKMQSHGVLDTAAFGLDAATKLWDGTPGDAFAPVVLREIASAYPPRLSLMLSCYLIRRLLRLGRQEEAIQEASQIGLDALVEEVNASDQAMLASAREVLIAAAIELHISAGRLRQASSLIAEETRRAKADGRFGRLVELAIDEAAIANCTTSAVPPIRHLGRAITLAAKRQYLRPFRDRGELMAALVNETKSKDWGFAVDEERRFFAEICRGLPISRGSELDDLNGPTTLAETPTARELEMLALVDAGLTNQQLADRLSVSVATVKWHLYNLYTKLGVSSRAAAIARARALNLLVR